MSTTTMRRSKPGAFRRLIFRIPGMFYHLHLGWMLGHRALMLTHQGRKSGKIFHTVLEVIRYDREAKESIVLAARGEKADWYRNIQANPAQEVRIGFRRYATEHRLLTAEEFFQEYSEYQRRHHWAARALPKMAGLKYNGSESQRRELAEALRMVAFRRKESK